ncbi:MAG: zinc finger CCCH domain-containing protein, partial [Flavobacteriaceae bacterium]|nr:zinc finger CCCH domain-containing protein [Flavobacteriaceae bacterium]
MTPNAAAFLQQGLPVGGFVPVGQHQLQQLQQQQQLFAQAQMQQLQQLQQLQHQLQQQQQTVAVGAAAQQLAANSAQAASQMAAHAKQQKQQTATDEDSEKMMWAAHQHLFSTSVQVPTLKAVSLPTPNGSQTGAGNGASQSPQASLQGSPQATPQASAAAATSASAAAGAKGQTPKAAGTSGKTPTASGSGAGTSSGKKSRQEMLLSKLKSAQIAPLPPSSTSSSPSNPPSKGGSLLPTPTALGNVTFSEAGVHVVAEPEATPTSLRIKAAFGDASDGNGSGGSTGGAALDFKPSYKSKPCRAFIKDRGVCRHGDKCLFSHDPALLDATPTAATPNAA